MLQRLGLAQALAGDPDLLILDEPTTHLDPVGRRDFREIVLDLKSRGKTVFISSHVLSEVESVCDRVAILQRGVLKRSGTLAQLSHGRGSRIVATALDAGAMAAIAGTGANLTLQGDKATIGCSDEEVRSQVERALASSGAHVESVQRETESLEDIFMNAVGRSVEQ